MNEVWELTEENKKVFNINFSHEILNDGDNGKQYNEYQKREYIEDGCFIKVYSDRFELWEIPQYGGEPYMYDTYQNINDLINEFKSLT